MPAKFIRCVKKVKAQHRRSHSVNPYAVCRVSTRYHGTKHRHKRAVRHARRPVFAPWW